MNTPFNYEASEHKKEIEAYLAKGGEVTVLPEQETPSRFTVMPRLKQETTEEGSDEDNETSIESLRVFSV